MLNFSLKKIRFIYEVIKKKVAAASCDPTPAPRTGCPCPFSRTQEVWDCALLKLCFGTWLSCSGYLRVGRRGVRGSWHLSSVTCIG